MEDKGTRGQGEGREFLIFTAYFIIIGTFITPPQPSPREGRVRDSAGGVYFIYLQYAV